MSDLKNLLDEEVLLVLVVAIYKMLRYRPLNSFGIRLPDLESTQAVGLAVWYLLSKC